eukprot:6214195-Pleurochrysis_carterae.AAC.10
MRGAWHVNDVNSTRAVSLMRTDNLELAVERLRATRRWNGFWRRHAECRMRTEAFKPATSSMPIAAGETVCSNVDSEV